ncbi:MAG TPA: thioredoxin domain-containing protein [Candidatus Limnocylindrales bacterium]|nr:thioredoxin domain-containing protein [Candidatus Limnocylindrales bacterium]
MTEPRAPTEAATEAAGKAAVPPRHTNRLATETSPYLLQHAHNPVDWSPWGPDALARAKLLDRPIFLSIGYAACHWCHVMERESFEDEATAAFLNAQFVPIKVDREERPDLDQVYMAAVQAMTGGGGWPMSVFLTPEGRPFYGGTYFPDRPSHGLPSFRQVLETIARAWREQRGELESAGLRLASALDQAARAGEDAGRNAAPGPELVEEAVATVIGAFDSTTGGWGTAPKFPQPMTIELLLQRAVGARDAAALSVARRALEAMAAGGIRDQLGGGFHRYATDARWLVPHFEQMLYDNAQLARVYLLAWSATGDPELRDVGIGVLEFMLRDLRRDDGTFASSLDADTDGVEGGTFTWHASEIRDVLGEGADLFAGAYGVTDAGNWEGRTILSRVRTDAELARSTGLAAGPVHDRLARSRERLLEVRTERSQPARDDKALAAWNGLAIAAFSDAARLLRQSDPIRAERYRAAAERCAEAILAGLRDANGRLRRSWKDGRASGPGVLEDYAGLADGLLGLYEATFDERWFGAARELADTLLDHFADPSGGFFDTADDHERLVTRPRDPQDNATPSGGSAATHVLLQLSALTGDDRYRVAAERALAGLREVLAQYPTAFARWLLALDLANAAVAEVAIVGPLDEPAARALLAEASGSYAPYRVVAAAPIPAGRETPATAVPLLEDRTLRASRPTAYVCRSFACQAPVTDPEALREQLAAQAAPA